jgi:hypothetical protein
MSTRNRRDIPSTAAAPSMSIGGTAQGGSAALICLPPGRAGGGLPSPRMACLWRMASTASETAQSDIRCSTGTTGACLLQSIHVPAPPSAVPQSRPACGWTIRCHEPCQYPQNAMQPGCSATATTAVHELRHSRTSSQNLSTGFICSPPHWSAQERRGCAIAPMQGRYSRL